MLTYADVVSLVSQPAADAAKPAADAASASPAAEPLANTHTNPNASSSLAQADASSSSSKHSTPPEEARDALKHTKPEMSGEGETSGKAPVVLKQSAAAEGGGPKRSGSMHQQVLPEARVQGAVTKEIYLTYLRELRYPMLALIGVIGMASQGARNGNDWWLTRWASAPDRERVKFYLGIYALSNVGSSVLFLIRDVTLMLTELQASSALHKRMLDAVMQAPMNFFDSTPVGRVLNRFSNDQESLDSTLPRTLNQLFSCALRVAGTRRQQSGSFPTVDIFHMYVMDRSINMGPIPVTMGTKGTNWTYTVPALGDPMPTGIQNPATGQEFTRPAEESDCKLFPLRRSKSTTRSSFRMARVAGTAERSS